MGGKFRAKFGNSSQGGLADLEICVRGWGRVHSFIKEQFRNVWRSQICRIGVVFRIVDDVSLSLLTGKKVPSDKTPALTKGTNMGFWVVGTSNKLFIRGS